MYIDVGYIVDFAESRKEKFNLSNWLIFLPL